MDNCLKHPAGKSCRCKLTRFYEKFSSVKSHHESDPSNDANIKHTQKIQKLILDKYKVAALEEIPQILPVYYETNADVALTSKTVARYLVEDEKSDSEISSPALGSLHQYVFENSSENRKKIAEFIEQNWKGNDEVSKRAIRTFMLEVDAKTIEIESVKKLAEEVKNFIANKEQNVRTCAEHLRNELKLPQYKQILAIQDEDKADGTISSELLKKIEGNKTLKPLYDAMINAKNEQYEWERCYAHKPVLREFQNGVRQQGTLLQSVRELLAYVYGANIRVYHAVYANEISSLEDHNPSATTVTHLLLKDSKFIQLQIDKDYLKLEQERQQRDAHYRRILMEIEAMEDKHDIDDYIDNKKCIAPIYVDENSMRQPDEGTVEKVIRDCSYFFLVQHLNDNILLDTIEGKKETDTEIIQKLAAFFPEKNRHEIQQGLRKVTRAFTGQRGILHAMLNRFTLEEDPKKPGKSKISVNELLYLINSVMAYPIDDREEYNTFSWIIAAFPQRHWIDEAILLQLENSYRKQLTEKAEWRRNMSKISNREILLLFAVKFKQKSCPAQSVTDILHLLSSIPFESIQVDKIELSEWPYLMKEHFWTYKLRSLVKWDDTREDLSSVVYYFLSIDNTFGTARAEEFLVQLGAKAPQLSSATLLKFLPKFHIPTWDLSAENVEDMRHKSLDQWLRTMEEKHKPTLDEVEIGELMKIVSGNDNTSPTIKKTLSSIERAISNICNGKTRTNGVPVTSFSETDIINWAKAVKYSNSAGTGANYEIMLAVIDRAIELKRKFRLRNTQRLAVLVSLSNGRNTLAQVSTGEGKSLIVVAKSLIKCLLGETVDIITSSSVLAKRDAEDNRDIYDLFGINVSHNASENIEKRKEAYSLNQVVYGDLASFQRDYLLDTFYDKNILGSRVRATVIVDEVDSMLLDKGNNMLYLSHDIAGMDKLESVYVFIWNMVNMPTAGDQEVDGDDIKQAVLWDLFGTIGTADIKKLDTEMGDAEARTLWECLVKADIIDGEGKLCIDSMENRNMKDHLPGDLSGYSDRLNFLLSSYINRDRYIHIPRFLRGFIVRHLQSWISSAINALYMVPDEQYVVDNCRSGAISDRNTNIIILDKDTGTDQASSQWDEALHQFLQLKHGCKLSTQSLKAVYISNVSYFKRYTTLYGLTGTLGSQRERDLLKQIHDVDFVTIPTAKSKRFEEYKPIICAGREKWRETICKEVESLIKTAKRSVLIICETVNDVDDLKQAFGNIDVGKVHVYKRDYETLPFGKEASKLEQRHIIIATNLAGRGTDIKISDQLRDAGGLHVCLAYLPANTRIEAQAFGRAARCGDMGTGQMIIYDNQLIYSSKIFEFKVKRYEAEVYRISNIISFYETKIRNEEHCFAKFTNVYRDRMKNLRVRDEFKTILMQCCLERWSFWLDEHNALMERANDDAIKRSIEHKLDAFLKQISSLDNGEYDSITELDNGRQNIAIELDSHKWIAWVNENPMQMVKLGVCLAQNDSVPFNNTAETLFNKVIEKEPNFAEGAFYYRAFVTSKTINWEKKPFPAAVKQVKRDLREAVNRFEKHTNHATYAGAIVDNFKVKQNASEGYVEQQVNLGNLYETFKHSIDDIFGHVIDPDAFKNFEIEEHLIGYIFNDLTKHGLVKRARIRKHIASEQIQAVSAKCGVRYGQLEKIIHANAGPIEEKKLRELIPLPNREQFWEILVKQNVLNNEQQFVVVNNEILTSIDPSLGALINTMVEQKRLTEHTIVPEQEQLILYHELAPQGKLSVFKTDYFISNIARNDYETLKEKNVFVFEGIENVTREQLNSYVVYVNDPISIEQILENPKNYALVDHEMLKLADTSVMNVLDEMIEKQQLKQMKTEQGRSVFVKDEFISIVGKRKYDMLETRGIISFNRQAKLDKNFINSCLFETFDSITAEDITSMTSITANEAELILEKLLKQNILTCEKGSYRLGRQNDNEEQNILPTPPIYEHVVKSVLTSCFSYRQALRSISQQLKEEKPSIRIDLDINPYRKLFMDLVEQNIICPPVAKVDKNVKKIGEIYKKDMKMKEWIDLLEQDLQITDADSRKLFRYLVGKGRIVKKVVKTLKYIAKGAMNLLAEVENQEPGVYFYINGDNKTEVHFTASAKGSELPPYDLGKSIETFLENRLVLTQTKHLENVLNTSKSKLKSVDVPKATLKSIAALYYAGNFGNVDELYVFALNGLEHLLQFEEKKWTFVMLRNTGVIVAMGLAQLAIGAWIELYSAGFMTHVGAGFISEGFSDIMYAMSAFSSGHFRAQDYRRQKIQSVITTVLSAGIGMYVSRGKKLSKVALKAVGPGLEKDGINMAEMAGKKLIEEISEKGTSELVFVSKYICKRVALKTIEGVALGLANATVDAMVEKNVRLELINMVSEASSHIRTMELDKTISENLREAYELLGSKKATNMVDDLTERFLSAPNILATYGSLAKTIASSIIGGFSQGFQKLGNKAKGRQLIMTVLSYALTTSEKLIHIGRICTAANQLLKGMNKEIEQKLKTLKETNEGQEISTVKPVEGEDYATFEKAVFNKWKTILDEQIGRILTEHFVDPVLKMIVHKSVTHAGKCIRNVARSIRETELKRKVKRLKKNYEDSTNVPHMPEEIKRNLGEQYQSNLREILQKTRSPTLFAAIIREGVPMDLTCVQACSIVIGKLLQQSGIDGLTIDVIAEHGITKSVQFGTGGRKIELELENNHYKPYGSDTESALGDNDCLFHSLSELIPQLGDMDKDTFRERICDVLENDKGIRHHIRQGWHRIPLKTYDAIGGARKVEWTEPLDDRSERRETIDPEDHFLERIIGHGLETAGLASAISEDTGIETDKLIQDGASMFQARVERPGNGLHRAHVFKGQITELLKCWPAARQMLSRFFGHTQNVAGWANLKKIAKMIDRYQAKWAREIANMDFNVEGEPTDDNLATCRGYIDFYKKLLRENISAKQRNGEPLYTPDQLKALRKVETRIESVTPRQVFEKAKEGYRKGCGINYDYNYNLYY